MVCAIENGDKIGVKALSNMAQVFNIDADTLQHSVNLPIVEIAISRVMIENEYDPKKSFDINRISKLIKLAIEIEHLKRND